MKLYIADIKNISISRAGELDFTRAERVKRCKFDDDKKRCIASGLFINKFLPDAQISINKFGKPLSDNGLNFNISHSGNYVLFALSKHNVGCDIQKIEFVNVERIAKFVFNENEKQLLNLSADKLSQFYKLWTKKESLHKCIGEGFHRSGKTTDVSSNIFTENGKEYYFRLWNFSDYVISVCSEDCEFPKKLEFIDL